MTPECAKVFMFKIIKYIMNGDVNKIGMASPGAMW